MQDAWPALPYANWKDAKNALHMYAQMVGKVALAHTPRTNHWWNCGLQVTRGGLETTLLFEGDDAFQLQLAFPHIWICRDGAIVDVVLLSSEMHGTKSVSEVLRVLRSKLRKQGIKPKIWPMPVEVADPIPFAENTLRTDFDWEPVRDFYRVLTSTQRVLYHFRSRFLGKASPVLFWWGTFDICVTLFSGRPAPPREGADSILREAMSHEEMSFGWWPGDDTVPEPHFYAYVYPEPPGIADEPLRPAAAFHSADKQEFFLPYEALRTSPDPDAMLLEFCESVYAAGAKLANWDPALLRS